MVGLAWLGWDLSVANAVDLRCDTSGYVHLFSSCVAVSATPSPFVIIMSAKSCNPFGAQWASSSAVTRLSNSSNSKVRTWLPRRRRRSQAKRPPSLVPRHTLSPDGRWGCHWRCTSTSQPRRRATCSLASGHPVTGRTETRAYRALCGTT